MDKKLVVMVALAIMGGSTQAGYQSKRTTKKTVVKKSKKPCKCYCSDKCGPRDATNPGDKPYVSKKYKGICFCQPRDERNYKPHGCHKKNPNPRYANNCCEVSGG